MAEFFPVEIIQALAGSGKTQLLAYRFIRLMKLGADPKTILATTFSRKAAGEIRDRIIDMLSFAILSKEGFVRLRNGVPELSDTYEEGRIECAILLQQLVAIIHRLNIGTIDSFFVKTASAFSDTLELTQGWTILDEVHEDSVFEEAVRRMTSNPKEIRDVAMILQHSKSGAKVPIQKTIEGIKKHAYTASRGVSEDVWMWGEPEQPLDDVVLEKTIEELESLPLKKGRQCSARDKAVLKLRSGDWKEFLTSGLALAIISESFTYYSAPLENGIEEAYQPLIKHSFAMMVNRMLLKNKSTFKLMQELNHCWLEAKHASGMYSFDDVTFQLSNSNIMDRLIELQFRLDGSIDHMLVDEFQDTSLMQWKVLESLIQEINEATNDRCLFFVGDVKQSLYSFRGGEPSLLRGLEDALYHAHSTRLDASWRCTPPILNAVNAVFNDVSSSDLLAEHSQSAASIWQGDFVDHVSAEPIRHLKGSAAIHTAPVDPDKTSLQLGIDKVVEVVSKLYTSAPSATIGVLVRSNTKQQIQRIVHALRTNETHVPASEFGGNPLTDSPAVTLLLSALLMADDQCNSVHSFHVATSPLGKALGVSFPIDSHELSLICRELRWNLLRNGYASVLQSLAEKLVKFVDTRERLRLWQLVELAESFASEKTLRPTEFVRIVRELAVSDPASSQVQVMTIHKSKGLSFDAVVVCDLDQAIWKAPDVMSIHDELSKEPVRAGMYAGEYLDAKLDEYKKMRIELNQNQVNDVVCLLYVAMTRARRSMDIILPARESARKHHKKLDGLLLQLLGEKQKQEPNSIVWTADGSDSNWVNDFSCGEEVVQQEIEPFTIHAAQKPIRTGNGIASASPSSLEGGGKVHVLERFSGNTNTAFDLGTITHKWFEDIEWLEELPTKEALIESAPIEEASRVTEEELSRAADRFLTALESDEIQNLLSPPDEEAEVYQEKSFVLRVDKGIQFGEVTMLEPTDIHGSIDRLVVYKNEVGEIAKAEVIDWKTDRVDDGELEEKITYYAPQLSSYRLAASRLLGISAEKVSVSLVFISIGKVCDISDKI